MLPPTLRTLRWVGQLTTSPPGTQRDPMTRSASCAAVEHPPQVLGSVRPVGVHLDERVVALLERPGEPVEVGRAQTLLAGAVEDVDLVVGLGQLVGELAGAVGRVVVEDADVDLGDGTPDPLEDRREVLALVVGRDEHDNAVERWTLSQRGPSWVAPKRVVSTLSRRPRSPAATTSADERHGTEPLGPRSQPVGEGPVRADRHGGDAAARR